MCEHIHQKLTDISFPCGSGSLGDLYASTYTIIIIMSILTGRYFDESILIVEVAAIGVVKCSVHLQELLYYRQICA